MSRNNMELAESMIDALNEHNAWKSRRIAEECMGEFCDLVATPPEQRDFAALITKLLNSEVIL